VIPRSSTTLYGLFTKLERLANQQGGKPPYPNNNWSSKKCVITVKSSKTLGFKSEKSMVQFSGQFLSKTGKLLTLALWMLLTLVRLTKMPKNKLG